jgi:ParB family chromosome partitioning protein
MALRAVPIDRVVVGERLRRTGEQQVGRLMASIREVGLINPITVGEETEDGYPLVAGLHRLEACKRLGLTEIDVHVVAMPDLQRQLVEVDENLAHSVLTTAQRAIFTARRKAIYLALHPETARHVAGAHAANASMSHAREKNAGALSDNENRDLAGVSMSKTPTFSEETARRTGRSQRIVNMDAQRGTNIPTDVLEIVSGTDLGRGKCLNAIMRMEREHQWRLCDHLRAGRLIEAQQMVNVALQAKVVQLPGNCTKEVRNQMARLENAWAVASDNARERWAKKLDKRGDLKKFGLRLEDII